MKKKIQKAYEARAGVMKALGHPTRLFIVDSLAEGERPACVLAEMIGRVWLREVSGAGRGPKGIDVLAEGSYERSSELDNSHGDLAKWPNSQETSVDSELLRTHEGGDGVGR